MAKRYIEIDSTYRNRTLYPNPADFEIDNKVFYSNFSSIPTSTTSTDPITLEGPIFPPKDYAPLAYFKEYLGLPAIPLGTIMFRGYLPYMYILPDNQIYLDELPFASTSPLTTEISQKVPTTILAQTTNVYNDNFLENTTEAGEFVKITRSLFLNPGSTPLVIQKLIFKSYIFLNTLPQVTVLLVSPNSYPPSNIDRFYQGKMLSISGINYNIVNYYINSNQEPVFILDKIVTSVPVGGTSVFILTANKTIVSTLEPFQHTLYPYPAYRFPLPERWTTAISSNKINTTTKNILSVKIINTGINFGIGFLVSAGTTDGGRVVAKLYYIASTDLDGNVFNELETLVNTTEADHISYLIDPSNNFSLLLRDNTTEPQVIVNTLASITSDATTYQIQNAFFPWTFIPPEAFIFGPNATMYPIITETDGPSPIQTISSVILENDNLAFVRTTGTATETLVYQSSIIPNPTSFTDWNPQIDLTGIIPPEAIIKDIKLNPISHNVNFIYNHTSGVGDTGMKFVYSLNQNPTSIVDFVSPVISFLPEADGSASLNYIQQHSLASVQNMVPAFAFVGKTSNEIFFVSALNFQGTLWGPSTFGVVNSEAGNSKVLVFIVFDEKPTIIYQSLDGIRITRANPNPVGFGPLLWSPSVLLVAVTGVTTIDVILNNIGCPYIVYNGSSVGNSPTAQLNVLSLGDVNVKIQAGSQYRIRNGVPVLANDYILAGDDTIPYNTLELPVEPSDMRQQINNYIWLYNRQPIDFSQTSIFKRTRDVFVNSLSLVLLQSDKPAVAEYVYEFIDQNNRYLEYSTNSNINGSGDWTTVIVDDTSIDVGEFASMVVINTFPCIAYVDAIGDILKFAVNNQTDGLGVWTLQTIPTGGLSGIKQSIMIEVENSPAVIFYATNTNTIYFTRNATSDGSGVWTQAVITTGFFIDTPMSVVLLNTTTPVVIALAFIDIQLASDSLAYLCTSTDTTGNSWNAPILINNSVDRRSISLALINNYPAVAYVVFSAFAPRIAYSINSNLDGTGIWITTLVDGPYSFVDESGSSILLELLQVDSFPLILYQSSPDATLPLAQYYLSYAINSDRHGTGIWSSVVVKKISDMGGCMSAIVKNTTIPIYVHTFSPYEIQFNYGIYHAGGVNVINDIRIISDVGSSSSGGDVSVITTNTPLSTSTSVTFNEQYSWNVLTFDDDNYNQLNYVGMYPNEVVCYDIELERLTLPNVTLASGVGNRIAFYPYIYVEFEILNNENQHTLVSNNENSINALFSVPIYNVNTPASASFVVLNGLGMKQTVKFNIGCNYRFKVKLSDGELFTTQQIDTLPPIPPNFNLQISAVFGLTRRKYA